MGVRQSSRFRRQITTVTDGKCSSNPAVYPSQFIEACSEGDYKAIQTYIRNGGNVNIRNSVGQTPLLAATLQNRVQVVNLLLDNGAKDNLDNVNNAEEIINLEDSIDEEISLNTSAKLNPPKHKKLALNKVKPINDGKKPENEGSNSPKVQGEARSDTYTVKDIVIFRGKLIGKGAFASVFEGEFKGEKCAVKLLYGLASEIQSGLPMAENIQSKSLKRFQAECERLQSFEHPKIVKHLGTRIHPETGHFLIALELMDCNLRQFFHARSSCKNLPSYSQRSLCYDIASAIACIHSHGIVHRDLCSDNILLDCTHSIPVAKICDFGMSKTMSTVDKSIFLVRYRHKGYSPPEAKYTESILYDPTFDIFSLGVIMIQIIRELPNIESEIQRKHEFSEIDPTDLIKPLIEQCLQEDMKKRPPSRDVENSLRDLL